MPRIMDIVTPLGADTLLFHSMRATESLGRLFDYRLSLLSTRNDLDPKALLGKNATVKVQLPKGGPRHFDGCVTRFALIGSHGRYARYEMVLRPWLWFLTRASDCRIFQKMTVPDIIKQIFAKYPNAAFELKLSGSYQPWDYCVQYRETDHNFIARLMEQEGIYTYYKHSEGKHTLILADGPAAHDPYPGYASIGFVADNRSSTTEKERITDWAWGAEVQSGKYVIDEYDFTKPSTELKQQTRHPREHEHAGHEIYDWPGEFDAASEGDTYVRLRMEELQARHERIHAVSNARGISTGHSFKLKGHPRADQNRQYLVIATHLELASNEHEAAASSGASFHASFEALPADTQYRSARETPKPLIQGLQTAKVVGPKGEEIYTDEYGRVKVHFHWDRHGKEDQNASCWIRVSQPWAGKRFGMIAIPWIGQEVVVEFIDGDPDRPLITGRVYNAEQMQPWALPANKTQSGILTRSSMDGAYSNANALRFEDKKGEEQLWLHAEKDYLTETEHDEDKWVGNDRRKTIDGNETNVIHKNRTERVDQNEHISIGQNRSEDVELNEHIEIGQNRTEFVGANETVSIGKNRTKNVECSESDKIGKNWNVMVGNMKTESVGLMKMTNVGAVYSINVGAVMNTAVLGMAMEEVGGMKKTMVGSAFDISAGESITLACGQSAITLEKSGKIRIVGTTVDIQGTQINHGQGAVSAPPPLPPGSPGSLLSGFSAGGLGSMLGTLQKAAGIVSSLTGKGGGVLAALGVAGQVLGMGGAAQSSSAISAKDVIIDGCWGTGR